MPRSVQAAVDVGQAAPIARDYRWCAAGSDIIQFALQHGRRNLSLLDRENSAITAALLRVGQLDKLGALHGLQQQARLAADADAAQQVTGRMVGEPPGKTRPHIDHPQVIDQELGELKAAVGQGFGARQPVRVIGKKLQVAMADHGGARPGRDDNRPRRLLKHLDVIHRQRASLVALPGVKCRLSAAGLGAWKFHAHPCLLQDTHDGFPDLGVKRIDYAGSE